MFSTEYAQYRDLCNEVYRQVNGVLSEVSGFDWVDREVMESGVIVNTYVKNGNTKKVIINYTDSAVNCLNTTVPAMSATVR